MFPVILLSTPNPKTSAPSPDGVTPQLTRNYYSISPGEYSVRSLLGYFDPEGQAVSDPHSLDLLLPGVQDPDPRGRSLRGGGDADHVGVPDWHHAEGDVLAAGVVGAPHLVDLVRLGHHHAVPLHHHRVGVHSALTQCEKYI